MPRSAQLHQLLAATKRIAHDLESVPDAQAAALAHALGESLRSVAELLQRPDDNAMHSQILEGAEQALCELPGLLDQVVAPQFRQICQTAVQQALQAECPTFMNEQAQVLEGILSRRTITSDRDYYRVLRQIDLLERSDPRNASLAQLRAIAAQPRARRHATRGRGEA